MHPDIVNLRQFYASPLGKKVRLRVRRLLRRFWPEMPGMNIVGLGYTTDLLPLPGNPLHRDSRIAALMPDIQGAIYWPVDGANHSVLTDVLRPPLAQASIHRTVIAHVFEHLDAPEELLAIWWRLLVPGGRMVLVVPNRHGIWSRFGVTPFSSGKAYTLGQLRTLLNAASFTVRQVRSVCFTWPSSHPLWLALFEVMEWLGAFFAPRLGGVLVVEVEKQIYAGVRVTPTPAHARKQWSPALGAVSPYRQ